MSTLLTIVLALLALGAMPCWPHSCSWGWGPSTILAVTAVLLAVVLVAGGVP
jgi:Protein of unknown function (DUF3309)